VGPLLTAALEVQTQAGGRVLAARDLGINKFFDNRISVWLQLIKTLKSAANNVHCLLYRTIFKFAVTDLLMCH
jgi:hypothetical protein